MSVMSYSVSFLAHPYVFMLYDNDEYNKHTLKVRAAWSGSRLQFATNPVTQRSKPNVNIFTFPLAWCRCAEVASMLCGR